MSGWRGLVVKLLKVPPEPESPPGANARIFRAARNFFYYKLVGWGISQVSALIGLILALTFISKVELPSEILTTMLYWLEILGLVGFVAQLPFTLGVTFLDYEMRWYIVTDQSLRIREGITSVKEKTMTFANIQNIMVRQGPLQRVLGIADVEVRNAGGGGAQSGEDGHAGEQVHVGYFRGVDNAQELRDTILEGVRKQRTAGLGDHEDDHEDAHGPANATTLVVAANELLAEARELRRSALG